jgi:hypothetical protein
MNTVTLDAETAALLVAGHLDILHGKEQDVGCCPRCCGPCSALKRLLDEGQLDQIVWAYGVQRRVEWWDEKAARVDRDWLASAWRMTACHEEPS